MAKVILWGGLKSLAGGKTDFDTDAVNVRALLDELSLEYPALKPRLEKGVSFAIDGMIYRDSWFAKIKPDSTVYILPYLTGG